MSAKLSCPLQHHQHANRHDEKVLTGPMNGSVLASSTRASPVACVTACVTAAPCPSSIAPATAPDASAADFKTEPADSILSNLSRVFRPSFTSSSPSATAWEREAALPWRVKVPESSVPDTDLGETMLFPCSGSVTRTCLLAPQPIFVSPRCFATKQRQLKV